MIPRARLRRGPAALWSAVTLAGLLGCGSAEDAPPAAIVTWEKSAEGAPVAKGEGPMIQGVAFLPAAAIPGRPLEVRTTTTAPGGEAVSLSFDWKVAGRRMAVSGPKIVVPRDLRRGDRVEVTVTATAGGVEPEVETAAIRVANRLPRVEALQISIEGAEGRDLGRWRAEAMVSDPDDDDVDVRFEWTVSGRGLVAEGAHLTRNGWERGSEVRLVAWARDGEGEGAPLEAAPFVVGNSPPDILSRPPLPDASGRFFYAIRAEDRDGDRGLRYALLEGPGSMSIDPFSGEVVWQAKPEDAGEHLVEVEVDDRRGGATRQRFFVVVEVGGAPAALGN